MQDQQQKRSTCSPVGNGARKRPLRIFLRLPVSEPQPQPPSLFFRLLCDSTLYATTSLLLSSRHSAVSTAAPAQHSLLPSVSSPPFAVYPWPDPLPHRHSQQHGGAAE